MSEIHEYLTIYLKKIVQVIQAKPFLKSIVEELFENKINEKDIEGLNETLEKLFGEDNKILNIMLIIYSSPKLLDEVVATNDLTEENAHWFLGLSLINGGDLTRFFRLENEKNDWDSLTHRVFLEDEIFLELVFERIDGQRFIIESNRGSVFSLIASLSDKLRYFDDKEVDENELRVINSTIKRLSGFIKKQDPIIEETT